MSTLKASELRIGNLLKLENKNVLVRWVKPEKIDTIELGVNYPSAIVDLERLKPIPLTEEWLVKLGFIENKKWFYKSNFLLGYLSTDDNLQAEWKFGGTEGGWNLINIKYVHQLQNIYFALTSDELVAQ